MPPSRLGQFGLWLQLRQTGGSAHESFVLPEGEGPLLAVYISADMDNVADQVREALYTQFPDLRLFDISQKHGASPIANRHACQQAFATAKPFAILLLGADLPPALIITAYEMGIPVISAAPRPDMTPSWLSMSAAVRQELLGKITMHLVPDQQSIASLRKRGVPAYKIISIGPFSPTYDPLPYNEADRAAIAELFHGRHSWFAACVPPSEEETVLAAHHAALRQSHLALLLLLPSDPSRVNLLAARIEESGFVVARRDLDEEPTDDVQVFLISSLHELGLWYRLAPVTYIGGTLSGDDEHSRDPFEAAGLGSAIIHGTKTEKFTEAWSLLTKAKATRPLTSRTEISAVAAELSQPDMVASLATKAWTVSTNGAAVAIEVANAVLSFAERAKT